jgi:hypothetical protein
MPTDNDLDNIDRMIEQGFLEDEINPCWEEDEEEILVSHN